MNIVKKITTLKELKNKDKNTLVIIFDEEDIKTLELSENTLVTVSNKRYTLQDLLDKVTEENKPSVCD